ncbi:MAG: AmmeMemoRadiSam system protein B [Candidatus Aureabacteria bacterium]|nr:AmmeMemoRadiSam system protein B [Candidatus Auribacterota bacterium]
MNRKSSEAAGYRVIREPAVAGQFYPGDAKELRGMISKFLAEAPKQKMDGRIVGLISPHAGYVYSGRAAACGYKMIEGSGFTRAIVLAPSHHVGFRGAALPGADAYRTPLGVVPIDQAACRELLNHKLYTESPRAHGPEHSLEVQIPFLQAVLKDFTLIPIVIGQTNMGDNTLIAAPLKKLLDGKTIIIASSDFTHYGYNFGYLPFTDNIKDKLKWLDMGAVEKIQTLDAEGFGAYVERTGATICGHGPIGVLLEALPKSAKGTLLRYDTSGDLTGDFSSSVSYVSMIFTANK